MALELRKLAAGERPNLSKEQAGVKKFNLGLSWDEKDGIKTDLDLSVLVLGDNEKMIASDSMLFFNSPKNSQGKPHLYNGGLEHSGDERTGAAEGDDETIVIDLSKLPSNAKILLAVATIYDEAFLKGTSTQQITFGRTKNAMVKLYNGETKQALYQFDLTEDSSRGTAVEVARIYLKDGEWRFTTLGDVVGTSANGLEDIVKKYNP